MDSPRVSWKWSVISSAKWGSLHWSAISQIYTTFRETETGIGWNPRFFPRNDWTVAECTMSCSLCLHVALIYILHPHLFQELLLVIFVLFLGIPLKKKTDLFCLLRNHFYLLYAGRITVVNGIGCVFSGPTDRTDLLCPIHIPEKHKKMSNSNSWKRCESCHIHVLYHS